MELYHNPANLFVAGFLGAPSMNFIEVDVTERRRPDRACRQRLARSDPCAHQGPTDPKGQSRDPGRASTVPDPRLRPTVGCFTARFALTERLGSETVVDIGLRDGSNIIAAISEDRILEPGSEIGLTFDADQAHLFPHEDVVGIPH